MAAVSSVAPPAGAAPETLPATQPAPPPAETPRQYIDRLLVIVGQGTQPQRDDAAQRLVEIGNFDTQTAIAQILAGNDERAQVACCRAIAEGHTFDPRWVERLIALLSRDRVVESAARALIRYEGDPRVYDPIVQLVRSRQQPSRTALIRLLGQVVQKPVAQTLVSIINDPTEDPPTRSAAADALQELSGQVNNGTSAPKWNAWLEARQAKAPADWRVQVLAEQHPLLERTADQSREQLRQFKSRVQTLLANEYDRLPMPDKPKVLLGYLNDPDPNVREIGAALVPTAVGYGQPITEDIHARLIDLIGDADPEVRREAAAAIATLADKNALGAILRQLSVENNDPTKIALLRALAKGIGNATAIPLVRRMVQDESPPVAAEAANTLKALAPLVAADPAAAAALFDDLKTVLTNRTGPPGQPSQDPGAEELRVAIIGAMARLARSDQTSAMDVFPALLNQNERWRTRRAALAGLSVLGEPASDVIAQELEPNIEPDPAVRVAAATALGDVGSFAYAANRLDASSRGPAEPDKSVQEAAWKAFQTLLPNPSTSTRELSQWADLFHRRREPEREVVVRRELARKLESPDEARDLATERQRIGELYLNDLKQPGEAVPYLRDALIYWEANQAPMQTVVNLVHESMQALVQSGQYHDAVRFGEQEIRRKQENQLEVGPVLWHAAEALIDKGDPASYRDAAVLIQESLAMSPALDGRYRDELENLRQRLPASASTRPG